MLFWVDDPKQISHRDKFGPAKCKVGVALARANAISDHDDVPMANPACMATLVSEDVSMSFYMQLR